MCSFGLTLRIISRPRVTWLWGDWWTFSTLVSGDFVQARHIPDHVSWDWLVFPPSFDADALLQMGKLQAWTLKPAVLAR